MHSYICATWIFAQLTQNAPKNKILLDELPISVKSLVPFVKKLLSSIPDILWDWIGFQLRVEGATEAMLEERRRGQEEVVDDSELEG